ncbi:DUF3786 domain-containing protein [Desulfofundulus thermosubterraneus]|uniref:DUF3786 domain-containing protein n=1 Tax=Desulfofundulus thermosubterraneus DSM 16057 TaxID=1121432 RepID=A0A1M6DKE7_9FIRM|nr:DUF3786 domain-containing protein [Desulfofundulus thermosubterraneus]SHI73458.1 protein of unknown function [Desulfofundulus thermosubterraneus DSM 16057]
MVNQLNALSEAVRNFASLASEPEAVVLRTGASFDAQKKFFLLPYLGHFYEIDLAGNVQKQGSTEKVPYNDRTLILQYLCSASGLPPRGRWLSFLELPNGAHHNAPFHTDALNPLAEAFGTRLEDFRRATRHLGGEPLNMGDAGAKIPALPKLPLAVTIWAGDEEFPPRANILFDAVAPTHLTTAALWVLGVELAHKLIAFIQPARQAVDWLGKNP